MLGGGKYNSARQNCCFHKNSTKLEMCQAIFAAYLFYCPDICPYLKRQRFPSMICPRPNCCSLARRTLRVSEYELEGSNGARAARKPAKLTLCRPRTASALFARYREQSGDGVINFCTMRCTLLDRCLNVHQG